MTQAVALTGQTVVGQTVTTSWMDGTWEINQGWGPSSYTGEPEGHGYAHWHAGVDVGCDCGTLLSLPHGLTGIARWIDNPGGYGVALRLELYKVITSLRGQTVHVRTFDVWLGHLRQRLVLDGQTVLGGAHLGVSNNTGNSTGCHLHFEVRPAGGRYGTDVDPSSLLLIADVDTSTTPGDGNPYNPLDPRYGFWELEHSVSAGITSAETTLVNVAQAGLGATLVMGGLVIVALGLRGKNLAQAGQAVRGTVVDARRRASSAEYRRQSAQQGEVRTDYEQQTAEAAQVARDSRIQAAADRRNTEGAYRAGLVSQAEAQRRLGYPVRRVGNKAARRAAAPPRGIGKRSFGDSARRSRIRPSHQKDWSPSPPAAGADDIPF